MAVEVQLYLVKLKSTVLQGREVRLRSETCRRCGGPVTKNVDGRDLRKEREKAGLPMSAVAKKMRTSITLVWMLETNQRGCGEMKAKRYLMAVDAIHKEKKEGEKK